MNKGIRKSTSGYVKHPQSVSHLFDTRPYYSTYFAFKNLFGINGPLSFYANFAFAEVSLRNAWHAHFSYSSSSS